MNKHSKIVTLAAVAVITAALSQAAWSGNFARQEQGVIQHGGRNYSDQNQGVIQHGGRNYSEQSQEVYQYGASNTASQSQYTYQSN